MNQPTTRLYRDDLVEVKAPDEILQTLDANGALDHLPFMPEMIQFCGRRFRVLKTSIADMLLRTRLAPGVQSR
jgi:hypothetical protein